MIFIISYNWKKQLLKLRLPSKHRLDSIKSLDTDMTFSLRSVACLQETILKSSLSNSTLSFSMVCATPIYIFTEDLSVYFYVVKYFRTRIELKFASQSNQVLPCFGERSWFYKIYTLSTTMLNDLLSLY